MEGFIKFYDENFWMVKIKIHFFQKCSIIYQKKYTAVNEKWYWKKKNNIFFEGYKKIYELFYFAEYL